MTPTLQIATLLAIIAATATSLVAPGGPPGLCPKPCPKGEVCTKQEVQCLIAPCPVFYGCKAISSPCLEKKCGHLETCVMTAGYEGYEEPKCVSVSHHCTNAPTTCAAILCPVNTECKMVGCSNAKCVAIKRP